MKLSTWMIGLSAATLAFSAHAQDVPDPASDAPVARPARRTCRGPLMARPIHVAACPMLRSRLHRRSRLRRRPPVRRTP